jgi:hypothetical protein
MADQEATMKAVLGRRTRGRLAALALLCIAGGPGYEGRAEVENSGRAGNLDPAPVRALFSLDHPETGPFPSDIFTIADPTHNTGRRVNLPYPDCAVHVSDCHDLDVINTLDGFGLQTRLSIPFDGPIDVNTATTETVFLISLGSTLDREDDPPGRVVSIKSRRQKPMQRAMCYSRVRSARTRDTRNTTDTGTRTDAASFRCVRAGKQIGR